MPKPSTSATEVVALPGNDRRQRRLFTTEEKVRILAEADACTERGQLGALLRREAIYSSHLSTWRAQLEAQGKKGLERRRPGPKPKRDDRDRLIEKLEREKAKLEKELRITRSLVELQKKAHEVLGIALPNPEDAIEEDLSTSSGNEKRRSR